MISDLNFADVLHSLSSAATKSDILAILRTIEDIPSSLASPDLILARAYAFILLDESSKAISLLNTSNKLIENNPYTWVLLGLSYRKLVNHDDSALAAYLEADRILPNHADILFNIGNVMSDIGDSRSFYYYFRSLEIDPLQASAWHNLHFLLNDMNHATTAYLALKTSICLDPFVSDSWCNLGLTYIALAQPLEAKAAFEISLSIDPTHKNSCTNIGNLLVESTDVATALPFLVRGAGYDEKALLNLGLCQLLLGDYQDGWISYEARLQSVCIPIQSPRLTSLTDLYQSSDKLLIWAEQGIGDSLMFVRYLSLLTARKIRWHFYCPNSLLQLFQNCLSSADDFSSIDSLPDVSDNYNIPLLSLPRLFETEIATIPGFTPYLRVVEPPSAPLLIQPPPGGLSIGLVWASDPSNVKMYKNKSIKLSLLMDCLTPLINLGLAHLHSFQVGHDADQLAPWLQHHNVSDWRSDLVDFYATSRLVAQMDLIISVDTAVAHLAGAMNIPVWLLLAANADFRWLLDRDDSPWYPNTMRLFRQNSPGDWDSVTSKISESLDALTLLDLKSLASSKYL